MSQWTHVVGCIRIDDLRLDEKTQVDEIKQTLGKVLKFDDNDWDAPVKRPPCGSEGSLEYDIWVNPHKSHMAAYTVSIWGDLRDYNDINEIKSWFASIMDKFMIRDAVLAINVEYGPYVILSAQDDDKGNTIVDEARVSQ